MHCPVAPNGASGQGALAALRKALRGIAVNPMPWAIALGALASWQQWQLPQAIEQTVAMLAAAASPVALFTMGAVLARSHMHLHDSVAPRLYVPLALAKLVAQPLLLWLLGQAAVYGPARKAASVPPAVATRTA